MLEKTHGKHGGVTEDISDLMENVSELMKKQIWQQKLKKKKTKQNSEFLQFFDNFIAEAGKIDC